MNDQSDTSVASRQDPLRKRYQSHPQEAVITDRARTHGGAGRDPFHGRVTLGWPGHDVDIAFGVHRAVGGYSDLPNPGDLLCGALAACLDATTRVIAERIGVELLHLEIEVEADVDTRGTLLVSRDVPVGFQRMRCRIDVRPADGTDPELMDSLIAAAEHSCVNLKTLLAGVEVETRT